MIRSPLYLARLFVALAALLPPLAMPALVFAQPRPAYMFDVLLDGKEIGSHVFTFSFSESGYQVQSAATYNVKMLFLELYRYSHSAQETWSGGCLQHIQSSTDDNGDKYRVTGSREGNGMAMTINDEEKVHGAECVRTFAYWDPTLLDAPELLNSQTGELEPVNFADQGQKPLPWNAEASAQSYSLDTENGVIHLWYKPDGHWLGLLSELENGRTLMYRPDGKGAPAAVTGAREDEEKIL